MTVITRILLHAFVALINFQRGSTELLPNEIFVAMNDLTDFCGFLVPSVNYDGFYTIPDWMQPGEAEFSTGVSAFVRLATGEHFEANLETTNGPPNHDPHPHGPAASQIRIGDGVTLSTEPFEIYNCTHIHHYELPSYPPANRLYVTMRGGPVYSAVLVHPDRLAMTHYWRRVEQAALDVSSAEKPPHPPHQASQSQRKTEQPPAKAAKTQRSSHPPRRTH